MKPKFLITTSQKSSLNYNYNYSNFNFTNYYSTNWSSSTSSLLNNYNTFYQRRNNKHRRYRLYFKTRNNDRPSKMHNTYNHHHHNHNRQRRSCFWPSWSARNLTTNGSINGGGGGNGNGGGGGENGSGSASGGGGGTSHHHHSCSIATGFAPPISTSYYTNKQGYVTIPGVENIDPFLLALRFYGFDLWMNRYAETGKRFARRNFVTKGLYFFALSMINIQMVVHVLTMVQIFSTNKKNFYTSLDDVRTFILKLTMTFAVDFWFWRNHSQAGMTHLVVINYLRANNAKVLRRITTRWMMVMLLCTILHWAISQYWVSSMTVYEHLKWFNIIQCAVDNRWFEIHVDNFPTVAFLRTLATVDSFIYRMYIYGGRFGAMCAYCLLLQLLTECIAQINRILTDHLDNEYHYHHHYCRRSNHHNSVPNISGSGGGGGIGGGGITTGLSQIGIGSTHHHHHHHTATTASSICVRFSLEIFKEQFNIVYRMHQEIEQCFGPLNFIWFGSLFVVTCIDIFFLAWNAGTEWFRVWSLMEFTSMLVLWLPHCLLAYYASKVSFESRKMKLNLKELCRQDEEVREIVVSSIYYPRIKPTLFGVVQLDIGFLLSFICTLTTFSVMLIQLNPNAAAKVG